MLALHHRGAANEVLITPKGHQGLPQNNIYILARSPPRLGTGSKMHMLFCGRP